MNRPREDWQRLASYVVSARLAAGFRDRREFEAATGISHRTLGKLENGQRVSPDTLAVVEQKVGWKPDSARMILAGGEPAATQSPESDGHQAAGYTIDANGKRHYPSEPLQRIWDDPDLDDDLKEAFLLLAEAMKRNRNGGAGQRSA